MAAHTYFAFRSLFLLCCCRCMRELCTWTSASLSWSLRDMVSSGKHVPRLSVRESVVFISSEGVSLVSTVFYTRVFNISAYNNCGLICPYLVRLWAIVVVIIDCVHLSHPHWPSPKLRNFAIKTHNKSCADNNLCPLFLLLSHLSHARHLTDSAGINVYIQIIILPLGKLDRRFHGFNRAISNFHTYI